MKHRYEIQIVLKDLSKEAAFQATHVGGQMTNGTPWKIPVSEAVENIRSGYAGYYVRKPDGTECPIVLQQHPLFGYFLTIGGEKREPRTLLSLPEVLEKACA